MPQNLIAVPQPQLFEKNKQQEQTSCGFNAINSEIARRVLSIALDKSPEELEQQVPTQFINEMKPPCRLERVVPAALNNRNVDVYLDVCHNVQGMSYVLDELTTRHPARPIVIIFGASSGKKVSNLLGAMEPHSSSIENIYCVHNLEHPRLQSVESLLRGEADYRATNSNSDLPAFRSVEPSS